MISSPRVGESGARVVVARRVGASSEHRRSRRPASVVEKMPLAAAAADLQLGAGGADDGRIEGAGRTGVKIESASAG